MADLSVWATFSLGVVVRPVICGFYLFIYWFIFPPSYVAFWDSKTPHRPTGETVSWCLETSLLRLPPWDGSPCLTLLSRFLSFLFCPTSFRRLGCLSGCLVSSASVQKLFCVICSAFKWSFNEFVGEKAVYLSYSAAILGLLPICRLCNDGYSDQCDVILHCNFTVKLSSD